MFLKTREDNLKFRVGHKQEIHFPYSFLGDITDIKATCDCADVYNDKTNMRITIRYKPREIPSHLVSQGFYKTEKSVTIRSKAIANDGSENINTLTFTGTVRK